MITRNILINYTSWAYDVTNSYMAALRGHKYHILPTSSSPIVISFALLLFLLTLVFNLHGSKISFPIFDNVVEWFLNIFSKRLFSTKLELFFFDYLNSFANKASANLTSYSSVHIFWLAPFFATLGVFFLWSSNAISEGTTSKVNFFGFKKNSMDIAGKLIVEPLFHSNLVRKGFKIGFILFIISEVMFFFGFFWGFFHSSISPTIQIGAVWPPIDVEFITVKGFAVANTVILLTSGATLTVAHYAFELIPQKRNKLYESNVPFTNSSESFEGKLAKHYDGVNEGILNAGRPEIYSLPFVRFLARFDHKPSSKILHKFAFPINLLVSPFTKHFTQNFSIWDTEIQAKLYINLMLNATLILAMLFMAFQVTEYFISPVNINTGIYGSTFYMITGLHGAHVFIGTCFLFYCRIAVSVNWNTKALMVLFYWVINSFFHVVFPKKILIDEEDKTISRVTENVNPVDHYGRFGIESFESAAWYWHFVDVVWIFVFGFVYVWSHLTVLDQQ